MLHELSPILTRRDSPAPLHNYETRKDRGPRKPRSSWLCHLKTPQTQKWLILPLHNSLRQTVEAVTGQNIPSTPATTVPQAPKPVVKEDWANCNEHKETLNSFKKC